MKEAFNIEDVALMTGLSTRTIRNYLSAGFLEGDKSSGAWKFTPEQIDAFMENPAIRPAVHARKNSIAYDFLSSRPTGQERMCVLLDLPSGLAESASAFFCRLMCASEPGAELRFASEPFKGGARVILSGGEKDVAEMLEKYREWKDKK